MSGWYDINLKGKAYSPMQKYVHKYSDGGKDRNLFIVDSGKDYKTYSMRKEDMAMVKITITGFAGRDTEKHGKVSCNSISAGARISGTKGADGKYEYMNEWYDVITFGNVLDSVKKGTKVTITGTLEYSRYTNKNGEDKITQRIIVETVDFPK